MAKDKPTDDSTACDPAVRAGFAGVTHTALGADPSPTPYGSADDLILRKRYTASGAPTFAPVRLDDTSWRLPTQFAYTSEGGITYVVPRDEKTFRTDLTSIPWVFAWLLPSNGPHVPGVLLHDGLVRDELKEREPTHAGPEVDRVEADRLLREANRRCGVPFLRRWLIWTGVMLATLRVVWSKPLSPEEVQRQDEPGWREEPRWWATMICFFGTIAIIGLVATLDLFDAQFSFWFLDPPQVPWMADRAWWIELLAGGAGAVIIPLIGAVVFGRYWRVGAIAGIWLAVLLHATLAVAATYTAIQLAERGVRTVGLR